MLHAAAVALLVQVSLSLAAYLHSHASCSLVDERREAADLGLRQSQAQILPSPESAVVAHHALDVHRLHSAAGVRWGLFGCHLKAFLPSTQAMLCHASR